MFHINIKYIMTHIIINIRKSGIVDLGKNMENKTSGT